MDVVIKISEREWKEIINDKDGIFRGRYFDMIREGTPLPKGHGRLIDISKIEEDRIEKDNPIIYLTIDGNYIEAISLDYLNNLSTIIEAESEENNDG